MEPDPPSPSGISTSVIRRAMQECAAGQRGRLRLIPRGPTSRPTSTGRQGQPTSILAHRMREPAPAWDNFRHAVGRNPRTADNGNGAFYVRGSATRVKRFRHSHHRESAVTNAYRWKSHGEACAGSTQNSLRTRLTRVAVSSRSFRAFGGMKRPIEPVCDR